MRGFFSSIAAKTPTINFLQLPVLGVICASTVCSGQNGSELMNQLCAEDIMNADFFFDGTWDGGATITPSTPSTPPTQIHPASVNRGRFGQALGMGDFDGDGNTDFIIGAPESSRTIERWDSSTKSIIGGQDDRRFYAGRIYLVYGPIGGTSGKTWPKRAGRSSRVTLGQNWGTFTDNESNSTDEGYRRADAWQWYNAFDITDEPRYSTSNQGDVSDETVKNGNGHTTTPAERIPGIVFQGSYGRYTSTNIPGATWANQPTHAVGSRGRHTATESTHPTTDLGFVNGHYGRVDTMDGLGFASDDVIWNGSPQDICQPIYDENDNALLGSISASEGEYERMGFTARFIGDINGDGCDDIGISSHEYDEYEPTMVGDDIKGGPGVVVADGVAKRYQPLNDGRLYVIFGQGSGNGLPRYEGTFDINGSAKFGKNDGKPISSPLAEPMLNRKLMGGEYDAKSLQGVTFKGARVHSLFGKDCAALPAMKYDNGFGTGIFSRSFNGDSIDDFIVASASFDADIGEMFKIDTGNGCMDRPDWRTVSCLHTGADPLDDLGLETGWGFTAIIYGKELSYENGIIQAVNDLNGAGNDITKAPSLNPWSAGNSFPMPDVLDERDGSACGVADKPNGVYFVGGSLFGYLAYGASAGDFDNDGFPDALLGHSRFDGNTGRAYVVFGGQGGLPNSPHTDHPSAWLMTTNNFEWKRSGGANCSPPQSLGNAIYNSQYWIDLSIDRATEKDFHQWAGGTGQNIETQIINSKNPGPDDIDDPATPTSLDDIGLNAGWAVWSAGDVDRDGYSDLLIGAPQEDMFLASDNATVSHATRGRTYLVYGYDVPRSKNVSNGETQCITPINRLSISKAYTLDLQTGEATWAGSPSQVVVPTEIGIFRGEHNGDHAGYAVSSAGDVNNDGYADFLISADWADPPDAEGSADDNSSMACHLPFAGGMIPGHNIRDHDGIWSRVYEYSGVYPDGSVVLPVPQSPSPLTCNILLSSGYENGHNLFVDIGYYDSDENKVKYGTDPGGITYDPAIDYRGVPGVRDTECLDFHADLGAVYLIYGKPRNGSNTDLTGDLELSDVGDSIAGHAIWGLTGRGVDMLESPGDYSNFFRKFRAPEFGRSLAGGQYFNVYNYQEYNLNNDGKADFLIGAPFMARPNGSRPFPESAIGGVIAYYDTPTLSGNLSAPTVDDLVQSLQEGDGIDVNGDGQFDIEDLRIIIQLEK